MSDDNDILGTDGRSRLTADITFLMLKGGGYALVFCLALWLLFAVLVGISKVLPEDSKFNPDPNLQGSITLPTAPLLIT